MPRSRFYVTGGTLRRDALSYVERAADAQLLESLLQGEFCHVLTPRQTGKSSLMVRTADRLREQGLYAVILDLTALGQNLAPEQWYDGLLGLLGQQLNLEDALEAFWLEHARLAPLQRWLRALAEVVLPRLPGPEGGPAPRLVLFIDEIDAVRSLPFSTDEFFAAIRQCYNRRTEEEAFARLTFCLLGVASPSDLIRDTRSTPFNIGRRVELEDFTEAEAGHLARGLAEEGPGGGAARRGAVLRRVLYWTGGHPYLTQRLCRAAAEAGAASPRAVDRLCRDLFLAPGAEQKDDNLLFVRDRLLRGEGDPAALLDLYARVLRGERIPVEGQNPLADRLRLAGLARVSGRSCLEVRNRIYAAVFDRAWVREHMPDAEARRLRAAYRRGLLRAGALAALVLAGMTGLAATAAAQAERAEEHRREADDRARQMETLAEDLRRALDEARRNLAEARAQQARALAAEGRERAERQSAQRERGVAEKRRAQAERARRQAEEQRRLATREQARLNVAAGWGLAERADPLGALPFFAEALRLEADGPARENHRLRLAEILRGAPRLLDTWLLETSLPLIEARRTPDRKRFLTERQDGALRVWDTETGKPVGRPLAVEPSNLLYLRTASFSANSRRLLPGHGRIQVWDLATGAPAGPPPGRVNESEPGHRLLTPDGRRIVTAHADGAVRLWNVAEGTEARPPIREERIPRWMALRPDGRTLVTAVEHRPEARFWDLETGRPLPGPSRGGGGLVFSPDGRRYAMPGHTDLRVFDAGTHAEVIPPIQTGLHTWNLMFGPDGRRIAVRAAPGTGVWDAATGHAVIPSRLPGDLLDQSPDGRRLLCRVADGNLRVFSAVTGEAQTVVLRHTAPVVGAFFTPDGTRVAAVCADGSARVWEAQTRWDHTASLPVQTEETMRAALSPDGRRVAASGPGNTARVWDARARRPVSPPLPHGDRVVATAFSPDGRRLATACRDGSLRVWDIATGRPLTPPLPRDGQRPYVAFSPDGRCLLTGNELRPGRAWILDARTGRPAAPPLEHPGEIYHAVFSRDGRKVATASADWTARVWEVPSGRPRTPPLRHAAHVTHAAFSPDGRRLATACWDGTVHVWDAETGRPLLRRPSRQPAGYINAIRPGGRGAVKHVEFSPDGRRLVTAGPESVARVWDAASGAPLTPPLRHDGVVHQARFTPDGAAVLTVAGHSSRLWDAATGQALTWGLVLNTAAEWSPDGRRLLAFGSGPPRLWEVPRLSGSARELGRLAEFLAGVRVEGAVLGAAPDAREASRAWRDLRRRFPGQFAGGAAAMVYHSKQAEAAERERDWEALAFHLDALIRNDSDNHYLFRLRGIARAERGAWSAAAGDFADAIRTGAQDRVLWYFRALALLAQGDGAGYREVCEEMFHRFGSPDSRRPNEADMAVWTCTLAPGALADPEAAARTAEQLARMVPGAYLQTLGAAHYRAGRPAEAARSLEAAIERRRGVVEVPDALFLALAHARLGNAEEARRRLAEAGTLEEAARARETIPWDDLLTYRLLRREAEAELAALERRPRR